MICLFETHICVQVDNYPQIQEIVHKLRKLNSDITVTYEETAYKSKTKIFIRGCCPLSEQDLEVFIEQVQRFGSFVNEPQVLKCEFNGDDVVFYIGPPELEKSTISDHYLAIMQTNLYQLTAQDQQILLGQLQLTIKNSI